MAHFSYCPFKESEVDAYVTKVMSFLRTQKNAEDLSNKIKVIEESDILHIVGHGHNFEANRLDGSLTGKPTINANDLADKIKNLIKPSHRLIMLDCCFAMGQYFNKSWWAGKSGDFLGKLFAAKLGLDHDQIIVGGSVNASTRPQEAHKDTAIGYEIGTKFSVNERTQIAFEGKFVTENIGGEQALVVPRLLFYVNAKGEWVTEDGKPSASPKNLW